MNRNKYKLSKPVPQPFPLIIAATSIRVYQTECACVCDHLDNAYAAFQNGCCKIVKA